MKHTTGNWNAVAQMPEGYSIETNEGKVIAFTQCDEDYNSENPIIRAEEMANANLIAAAPEMLNLLEWIINEIENTPDCLSDALLGMIKIKANKAIKKATE
jgi:hypothetical protein